MKVIPYLQFSLLLTSVVLLAFPTLRNAVSIALLLVLYAIVVSVGFHRDWRSGWLKLKLSQLPGVAKVSGVEAWSVIVGTIAVVSLMPRWG